MKTAIALVALFATLSTTLYAHVSSNCYYTYDRWGNRARVCRTVHHSHPANDAVVIGALAGATAGFLTSTCAPEVVDGNMTATQRALNEIAASEEFASAEKFQDLIAQINETSDVKEKMSLYFTLVDVQDSSEIAYFIGARDSELKKYAQALEQKADLDATQSERVVKTLVRTLKGNLN